MTAFAFLMLVQGFFAGFIISYILMRQTIIRQDEKLMEFHTKQYAKANEEFLNIIDSLSNTPKK